MLTKKAYDACGVEDKSLRTSHKIHYMDVEWTWFLTRKVDPSLSKKALWARECKWCQSIDPALNGSFNAKIKFSWEH